MSNAPVRQAFQKPAANEPCFCPSGKAFAQCCGSTEADRAPPWGIHIVRQFLSPAECEALINAAGQSPKHWLEVTVGEGGNGISEQNNELRKTREVKLGKRARLAAQPLHRAWTRAVPEATGLQTLWYEPFQMLCYVKGGFYITHADSERYVPEHNHWEKTYDRDLSLLVYINEDFTGGELHFPFFDYDYHPRAGDLVIFPSDHRYLHQAQPVTSGTRYALVSWAAMKGQPRLFTNIPDGAINADSPPAEALSTAERWFGGLFARFGR